MTKGTPAAPGSARGHGSTMTTEKQDSTEERMIAALLAVRDEAALIELSGRPERGRNVMAVVVALARCLHRGDDTSLGLLATEARQLLEGRLQSKEDGEAWESAQEWRRKLIDDVSRAIVSGAAENQRWLARALRRRLTVNRHNPPVPAIAVAMLEDDAVLALEKLDERIADELPEDTGPGQEDSRATAVACVRAALKALGATADERKSWLEAERGRRRRTKDKVR